ncbi:conserved Plasmodium protein, unknown function [Plasmodium berghei ANKA]|uniref:Zinc finger protein n=1 Tax=Plasmodium berghei (strain Anka) TaxID=5823 RepID=A0A509APS6_PLABA|nr:conserved Plasmodium protein, unknown function [Plasmodium berghei ANKA]VUC57999.1 conserved Plasmodium protein, unknown function [Plasmodium berghei ANKA]|eukprot:XP_034423768.1 conserved Plasmodium protein, unknown function [Plasmodium berghei ANKA]
MFKSIVPTTVGLNNSNYVHANIDEGFNFYSNGNNNISNNFPKKENGQIAIEHEQILNVSNSYKINVENLVNAKTPEEIALRILKSQNIQNKRKYTDNNNANYEINKKSCNLYNPNLCYVNNSSGLQENISSQNKVLNQKYSDQHYFKYNFSEYQFQNNIKEKWKRHSDNRVVYNTHGNSQNLFRPNSRTSNDINSNSNNNNNYYNDFHNYYNRGSNFYNNNYKSIYTNRPNITNDSQFFNFQKIPNRAHNSVPLSQFNDPQNMNYIDSNIINQIDMIKFAYKTKFHNQKNINNIKHAYNIEKSNYCNNIYLSQNNCQLDIWPNISNPAPNYIVQKNIHIEPHQNNKLFPILETHKFEKKTDEIITEIDNNDLMNINGNSQTHKMAPNLNEEENQTLEKIINPINMNNIVDKNAKIQTEDDNHKIDTEKIDKINNSIIIQDNKNDLNENKINNHNINIIEEISPNLNEENEEKSIRGILINEEKFSNFIENDKSLPLSSLMFEPKKELEIFKSPELLDQTDDEILYTLKDRKNKETEKYKNDYINLNKDDDNKMRIFFEQNIESFLNLDSNDINRNKKLKNIISSIEICLKCEKDLTYADTRKIEILFDKLLSNIDSYTNREISYRKFVKEYKEVNSSSSFLDEYGNENSINDEEEDEVIQSKLENNTEDENMNKISKKYSQKNRQTNTKKNNLKNNSIDEKTNTNNISDIIYGNYNILLYLLLLNFTFFKNYIDIEEINKHILINLKTNFKNIIIKLCENEIKNKIIQFYNIHEQFLIQLIWIYEKVLLYIYDIYIYIEKYDTVLINLLDLCLLTFQTNYNIQIIILHSINLLLKVFNTNQLKNMKRYILDNLIMNINTIDFKYNKINFKNSHTNSTYIHLSIFLIIKIAESFSFYYGDIKKKFILQQKFKQIKIQNKLDKKTDKNVSKKFKNGKKREKIYSMSSHDYSRIIDKDEEDEEDEDDEEYNFYDEYSRGKKGEKHNNNNNKLKLKKKNIKTTEIKHVKDSNSSSDDSFNFSIFTSENDSEILQSDIFLEKKLVGKPTNSDKVSKLRNNNNFINDKNVYIDNSKHLHKSVERKYSMRKKTKPKSDIYEYDNLNDTHDMKIMHHNKKKKNRDTIKVIAPIKYSDSIDQYFDITYQKESLKTYEAKKKTEIANLENPTEEALNKFMMEQNFKRLNNIINYILIEIIKKILYDDNKNGRNILEVIVLDLIKCCDNPLLSLSTMFIKNLTHLFFDILNKKQENNIKETCLFILRYMIKYIFSIYNYINNSCFHLLYNFNNETKNNKFIKPILNIKDDNNNNNNHIDPIQNDSEIKLSPSFRKANKILNREDSKSKKLTQTAKNKKAIIKGKNPKKKNQKKNEQNESTDNINITSISNDNENFKKNDTEKKNNFKCCHEKKEGEQIVLCSICEQLYHITCINKGFNKLDLENNNILFSLEESKTDEASQEIEENYIRGKYQNIAQKEERDKYDNKNSGNNNDISKFLKYNCDNCKIKNNTKSFIIKETQRYNSILNISLKRKKEKKNGFYCMQKFLNNLNIFDIYYYYLLIYIKKDNLNENIEKNFNNIYTYILLLYNNFIYTSQVSQNLDNISEDHKLIETVSVKKKKENQTNRKNKKNRNNKISDISNTMCKDIHASQYSDQNIFELMREKNEDSEMKEKEKIVFLKKTNNLLIYEFKNVKENQDTILSLGDMYNFDIYISHIWKLYLYFFFYDFFTISFNQLFYILYENNNKNLRYYSISIINNIINDNYLYLKCKQTQNILLSCLTDNYLKVREYTLCIFYNFCKSFLEVNIIINRTLKPTQNFLLKNRKNEKKNKDFEISQISDKIQNIRSKDIDSATNNTSENEYEWNHKNSQINLNEYITDEIIESVKRCTKDIKISVRIISVKILKYIIYFNKYIKRYNLLKQDDNTKYEENNYKQFHKENKINDSISDNVLILNDLIERYASPFDNETMKNTVLEILIEIFFINIFAFSKKKKEMEYLQDRITKIPNKDNITDENEQNYKSTTSLCKKKNYSENLSQEIEYDRHDTFIYAETFNDQTNNKYIEIEEDINNLFIHLLYVFKNKHDINIINKMLEYMDKNFRKYEEKLNIMQNMMNKYNVNGEDYEEDENNPETKKKEEKKKKLIKKKKKKKNAIKNKRSKQDIKNDNIKYNYNDEDEYLNDSNSQDELSSDDEEKLKNKENYLTKTKNNIYNIYINNYYKYIEILRNKCIKYILEVWIYNLISLFVKTRRNKIHENETKKIIKIFNIIIEIYPNLFIKYLTFFYLYIYNNDVSKDICELLSSVIPHCKLDLHLKLQLKKIKFNNTLLYHNNISISRSYVQLLCSLHTYIFSNFSYFKNYIEDCFIALYKYKLFFLVNNYIHQLNDFVREFYYMSEEDKIAIKFKLCQLHLLKLNEKDNQNTDKKEKLEDHEFQKQIQSQGFEDTDKNNNLQNPENFFLCNIIDITYENFICFLNEYKKYIFEIFSISHNDILNINKYTWLISVIMEFINVNKIILNNMYKDEIDTKIHATLIDEINENKNSNKYSNDKKIKYIKLSDLNKKVQIYTNGILYFEFMHNKQMDYIKKWNILKLKKEIISEIINKKFNINKIESFADICNYKFYDVVLILKKLLIDLFYISNDIKCKSFFLLCLSKILSNYHNSHYINDLNLRNLFFFCINSQNPSLQKNFLYILLQLIKAYEHFFNNKDNIFYTHSVENHDNFTNSSNKNKNVLDRVEPNDLNCKTKRKQGNSGRNNKDNYYKKEKRTNQTYKIQSKNYEKESNSTDIYLNDSNKNYSASNSSTMFANTDYKSNENNNISKGINKLDCKNNKMKIEASIGNDAEIETQIGDEEDIYDAENSHVNKSKTEQFDNKKKFIQKKNKEIEITNKKEINNNNEDKNMINNNCHENENKFSQQTNTTKNKNNMHVLLLASLFTQKIVEIIKINQFYYLDCSQEELNHIKNLGVQILNHLYREGFIQSTSICPTIFPLCFSSDVKLKLQGQKVINFIMEKENYNFLNNLSECLQGLLFYIIENYYIKNRKQNYPNNEDYKNIDNMNQFFLFSQMEPIFFKTLLDIYEKLETKKLKIMFLKIILKQIENTSHFVLYEKVISFVRYMNQKYPQYNQTEPQNYNDSIYTEMYSKNGAVQICSIKDIYCYISKNYFPQDRQRTSNDFEENSSDENLDTSENDEKYDENENEKENSYELRKGLNSRKNKRNGSNKLLNSKESINFESVIAYSTTNYENLCNKDTGENIYIKIKKKYNNILEEHIIIDEYTIVNYFLFLYLQILTYLISYINFSTYNEIAILIHDINRVYSITSSTINIGNDADKVKPDYFHLLDEHIKQITNEDDNIREKEILNTPYITPNLNKIKCFIIVILNNLVTNLMGNYNLSSERLSDLIDDNNLKENKIDEEKKEEKKNNFNYYDYIYECIDIYMGNPTEIVNKYSKHNLNTYEMNNDYLCKLINEGKNKKILQKKKKKKNWKKSAG